jgi:ABC-type branched-subunit amino acid transport system substrate-binding protein
MYNKYKLLVCFLVILFLNSCKDYDYFFGKRGIDTGSATFYTDDVVADYIKTTNDKLRVAVLMPLSGQVKIVGEAVVNAIQLSLFENNKKNILLKVYDTEATTFGAVNAINRAIKDGVDVVVGPLFSSETKAIASILKKNELISFSLSNDQELMNTDSVFVISSIPEQEIQTLISYMAENDFYNYVALMPNTAHGALMNKIMRNTIVNKDGLLIKTEFYEANDRNLLTKINDLINFYEIPKTIYDDYEKRKLEHKLSGATNELEFVVREDEKIYPQALFIPDGGKIAEQIANLLFISQKNSRAVQLIGTTKFDGDESILMNPYMNNAIFVGADPVRYEKFSTEYEKIYRTKPLKITSAVYDLISVIDRFFVRVDGAYIPDKRALLNPEGFDGIDGKYRFLPNGLVERKMYVLQFQNKKKVVVSTNQEFLNY